MSFFFNDFFGGGGMPGGHHFHGHGDDSDDEPIDTQKFYDLLGVEKNATQDQIKKAYRKKAKSLHPDRHPDEHEKYQELFQEVQAAHEVLKDPQKRALYDKYGEKGAKRGGGGGRGGGGLFEQMFGGGHGGRGGGHDSGPKKSPQIKTALDVTLEDIYCGSTKKIKIHRRVATDNSSKCPRCKGQGQITQVQRMGPMVLQQRRECPQCGGIGYKLERQEHEIEVHVPVGGRHGENITIQDEGHQYPDMAPGDVIIQLRQLKHKLFERKGADLGMNYKLSLRQALCGYKIKIPHVSGKTLVITQSEPGEITQPGSLKVVHTLGLPQRYSSHIKGHLYIVMEVEMPKSNSLSSSVIKQFEKILPEQDINENDDDDNDEEEDEKESKQQQQQQQNDNTQTNGNNNNNRNNNNNNSKQQPQRKKSGNKKQNNRNKGGKGRKNNKKKNGKKGGNKKKNKNTGGMFGGLAGAFGGGNNNNNNNNTKGGNKQNDKMSEDEDEDDMIEEVECHTVDGNPKATPATASNYYQDDDDDGDGVQCRQM